MMFKWRLRDSPACDCGNDRQTIKSHYKGMQAKEIQPGHRRNPRDNTGSSKVDKGTGRTP
ncbi:Hypothetical protein CINCED_3A010465, partial [Cinara cedri]